MKNVVGEGISSVIDGMKVPNVERAIISIMLHSVVFDTQKAIYDLVSLKNYTSASALLRVMFEAHVRGLWIYSCASNEQISQFKEEDLKSSTNPSKKLFFNEMVNDVEQANPQFNGSLMKFKENHWKGLNSLTHAGMKHCKYIFSKDEMVKSYSDSQVEMMIDFSNRFAIGSLAAVGKVTSDTTILKMAIGLFHEYIDVKLC